MLPDASPLRCLKVLEREATKINYGKVYCIVQKAVQSILVANNIENTPVKLRFTFYIIRLEKIWMVYALFVLPPVVSASGGCWGPP